MKSAISELFNSKKAIVCFSSIVTMAAVIFGDVDPELAPEFIDKLTKVTMAYLGAQGLSDVGKSMLAKKAEPEAAPAAPEDDNSGQESRATDVDEDDDEEEPSSDTAVISPPPKVGA